MAIISETDLDDISLEQALKDVEVANARVIDLIKRLSSLSAEVVQLRDALGEATAHAKAHKKLESELFAARVELEAQRLKQQRENAKEH